MDKKILVIGNSYMNLRMKINPKKKEGNTVESGAYRFHAFGKSVSTAISIAKLGGSCAFCTKLGADTNGERLMRYYEKCGIITDNAETVQGYQTGMSVTLYDDLGGHTNYVSRGVGELISREDIDNALASYPDALIVPQEPLLVAHEVEEEISIEDDLSEEKDDSEEKRVHIVKRTEYEDLAVYALNRAAEQGLDLILEYNSHTAKLPLESLKNVKTLIISEDEIYALTGFFPDTADKAVRAIISLSAKIKAKFYVINRNGTSFVYDGNTYEYAEAPHALKTASEGKEFFSPIYIGAYAYEFFKSRHPVRAARYAQIVTLLARAANGNLEYIPSTADIEKYMAENKIDLNRNSF